MRLFLDQMFRVELAVALRVAGHDVVRAEESGLARAENEVQQAAIGNQAGGRVWLFLHSTDFAGDHARMQVAGVVFEEEPRHEVYGVVAVWRDPWGNRWDLIEPA